MFCKGALGFLILGFVVACNLELRENMRKLDYPSFFPNAKANVFLFSVLLKIGIFSLFLYIISFFWSAK
jgi:mannose/fructose/N-acetylgalactosamine-specific phosphotransferase system component IIC